jgi:hypothetical protein
MPRSLPKLFFATDTKAVNTHTSESGALIQVLMPLPAPAQRPPLSIFFAADFAPAGKSVKIEV